MRSNRQLGLFLVGITIIAAISASGRSDEPERWYVDVHGNDESDGSRSHPFATLPRAQAAVRSWLMNGGKGNVEVLVGAGIYELEKALEFSSLDSAPAGSFITFAPLPHAVVTISGGKKLTDWQSVGELWQVEVNAHELHRQLFIDGQPAIRCREPDRDFFRVTATGPDRRTRLSFDSEEWSAPLFGPQMELILLHDWCASRVGVRAIEPEAHEIVLADSIGASHDFFRIDGFEPHPRFRLENAREFIDEPLEWFHDRSAGKIMLKLPEGETPDQHQITLSRLASLIHIQGGPGKPVRGIRLRGLGLQHTTCPIPSGGFAEIQASFFERRTSVKPTDQVIDPNSETGNARLPAAIELEFANDCAIEKCSIKNLGGGGIYLIEQLYFCKLIF